MEALSLLHRTYQNTSAQRHPSYCIEFIQCTSAKRYPPSSTLAERDCILAQGHPSYCSSAQSSPPLPFYCMSFIGSMSAKRDSPCYVNFMQTCPNTAGTSLNSSIYATRDVSPGKTGRCVYDAPIWKPSTLNVKGRVEDMTGWIMKTF